MKQKNLKIVNIIIFMIIWITLGIELKYMVLEALHSELQFYNIGIIIITGVIIFFSLKAKYSFNIIVNEGTIRINKNKNIYLDKRKEQITYFTISKIIKGKYDLWKPKMGDVQTGAKTLSNKSLTVDEHFINKFLLKGALQKASVGKIKVYPNKFEWKKELGAEQNFILAMKLNHKSYMNDAIPLENLNIIKINLEKMIKANKYKEGDPKKYDAIDAQRALQTLPKTLRHHGVVHGNDKGDNINCAIGLTTHRDVKTLIFNNDVKLYPIEKALYVPAFLGNFTISKKNFDKDTNIFNDLTEDLKNGEEPRAAVSEALYKNFNELKSFDFSTIQNILKKIYWTNCAGIEDEEEMLKAFMKGWGEHRECIKWLMEGQDTEAAARQFDLKISDNEKDEL